MNVDQSNEQNPPHQTIYINHPPNQSNGIAVGGFICALIALFLGWVPVLGWGLWVLGLVLSAVGLFKQPRGFAIAGLVISLIGIVLFLTLFGLLISIASMG